MPITAEVLADSLAPCGTRLTTFLLTYPRFIHAQLMTHRVFSRNVASSRAIPTAKFIDMVLADPAYPAEWGKNQKGMQATELVSQETAIHAKTVWWNACLAAVRSARQLLDLGVHKQLANRLLEPFAHVKTVLSGTEWGNFYALRVDDDAQPEIELLASSMARAHLESKVKALKAGQWHLPFWRPEDEARLIFGNVANVPTTEWLNAQRLKTCTARCARASYLNFLGKDDPADDVRLHDELLDHGHMSPFEHCAQAMEEPKWSGNFRGFGQYRKQFANENRELGWEELAMLLEGGRA